MKKSNIKNLAVALFSAIAVTACASTTPTKETEERYAIYDVKPKAGVTTSQISASIRTALQKNMSGVQVTNNIPPHPLPEEPGRFKLEQPFKNSNLGILAAASGTLLKVPTCEDSALTATATNNSMAKYGENTTFFLCLLPYQNGYHVNVYSSFTKSSGAFSVETLGATLARSVVGDSSQFIDQKINAIMAEIESVGAQVQLVEAYP